MYGLAAPGTLVNVPVTAGMDCRAIAALVQLSTHPQSIVWNVPRNRPGSTAQSFTPERWLW